MTAAAVPWSAPIPQRLLTLDDVVRLSEEHGRKYELVDGDLVAVSPPTWRHNRVSLDLAVWLSANGYEDRVTLASGVRTATDNENNGRIPDLVVAAGPVPDDTVWLAPGLTLLAVEIVSKGSERTDRWFKPVEYARAGIPFFWRVEPDDTVVQFRLSGNTYTEQARVPLTELLAGEVPPLE